MSLVFSCDVCVTVFGASDYAHYGSFVRYATNGEAVKEIEMCAGCTKRVEKFIANGLKPPRQKL